MSTHQPGLTKAAAEQLGRADQKGMSTTLVRGLEVLSAFRGIQETLSNSELADRLNLSRPTITRLCNSLSYAGFLTRVKPGNFRLGLKVLELAYPVLSSMSFRQRALPVMREFAEFNGGAVSLAMIHGPNLIFVQTVRVSESMAHTPDVGVTGPLFKSAMGRALLSMLTPAEYAAKVDEMVRAYPDGWQAMKSKTEDGIAQCCERGFNVALGQWRPGFFGAGAPIKRMANGMCLAINCGVPEHKIDAKEFIEVMGPKVAASAKVLRVLFADL